MTKYLLLSLTILTLGLLVTSAGSEPSTIDAEAEVQAQHWLTRIMTRCEGNVSVSRGISFGIATYYQFLEVSLQVVPAPLTSIDTLNTITWKGTFHIETTAQRRIVRNKVYARMTGQKENSWEAWVPSYGLDATAEKKLINGTSARCIQS